MCVVSGVEESVCGINSVMTAGELDDDVCGCDRWCLMRLVSRVELRCLCPLISLLRVVMTHWCPMWFVLVTGCRLLVTPCCVVLEWHGVDGHVQTTPCGPSRRRVCLVVPFCWQLPAKAQDKALVYVLVCGILYYDCMYFDVDISQLGRTMTFIKKL